MEEEADEYSERIKQELNRLLTTVHETIPLGNHLLASIQLSPIINRKNHPADNPCNKDKR